MKKKTRKRLLKEMELQKKEAQGDFSHLKDRKGNLKEKPMAQPTLPNIDLEDDGYAGSIMSARKDPYYFNGGGASDVGSHRYPPGPPPQPGYNNYGRQPPFAPQTYALSDPPRSQFQYAGTDLGYEASIHSMDKNMQYDHPSQLEQPYVPPYAAQGDLSKAPSYRSQTSLHDTKQRWDDTPPTPALPDVYAAIGDHLQHQPQASIDSDSYSHAGSYRAAPRDRLRENVERQHQPQQHDTRAYSPEQPGGAYSQDDLYGGYVPTDQNGRPDSLIDFSDYYGSSGNDQHHQPPHR